MVTSKGLVNQYNESSSGATNVDKVIISKCRRILGGKQMVSFNQVVCLQLWLDVLISFVLLYVICYQVWRTKFGRKLPCILSVGGLKVLATLFPDSFSATTKLTLICFDLLNCQCPSNIKKKLNTYNLLTWIKQKICVL